MTAQNQLRVKTDLRELRQVLKWFEQLNQPCIPREIWIQCQTALAEGFTNAAKHAHKDLPVDTAIDIDVKVTEQQLEIRIWDSGPAFDLLKKLDSKEPTLDLTSSSGRGLELIRRIADQFSYTRTEDDRNCLWIAKHL